MKKFIKGTPNVRDKVDTYKDSLLSKYKINSDLMRKADLIILDGLLIKDREYPITEFEGSTDITDLNSKTRNIIIGCRTVDDKIRVYRNF